MKELLQRARDVAQARGVQFMDARSFEVDSTDVQVQDGKADKVDQQRGSAVGLRVLVDDAWGFASTDVVTAESLDESLSTAIEMARESSDRVAHAGVVADATPSVDTVVPTVEKDPRSVSLEEKVRRISDYEAAGVRVGNGKISNSRAAYGDSWSREVVCNTFGTLVDQEIMRTMIYAVYTASDGTTRQTAFEALCEQAGFELLDRVTAREFSELAATKAVDLLSADRCPSGAFPVVLDPTLTGVFTHEMLGHIAEADFAFNGRSIISDKTGQKIASDCVTIVDDATLPGLWGSYAYDSEGMPGQKRTIIEDGVLKSFMHSLETASRYGVEPNGSGRAQDAHNLPMVRMSNTYIAPGEESLDDLVKGIDEGLLIQDAVWGQVQPEKGQYKCAANRGRMIRNGELAEPIREIMFCGSTLETLRDIDAVSSDLVYWPGLCGKSGQTMPNTNGGPYIRV